MTSAEDEPDLENISVRELAGHFRRWVAEWSTRVDPSAVAAGYDRFAEQFTRFAQQFTTLSAWARLGAGAARGEDVPSSIHVPDGEDPTDTARWRKWRVS